MSRRPLPEATIDASLKCEISEIAQSLASIEDAERIALSGDIAAPLRHTASWTTFCLLVTSTIHDRGYVVVRGLNTDQGKSLLIASAAMGKAFDTYRPEQIVKRFRMSPWTRDLSHTTQAGDFHTDGNVSATPPVGTALQCEREDPGAPEFAEQRAAHLADLLDRLASGTREDRDAHRFLTEAEAALAHGHSSDIWRGRLVQSGAIRYHPHSLRVAEKRLGNPFPYLESTIATIHRAAMDVSIPFHTGPGDVLLLSNRTALHYRGPCSVKFNSFPLDFESRSVLVLHLKGPAA